MIDRNPWWGFIMATARAWGVVTRCLLVGFVAAVFAPGLARGQSTLPSEPKTPVTEPSEAPSEIKPGATAPAEAKPASKPEAKPKAAPDPVETTKNKLFEFYRQGICPACQGDGHNKVTTQGPKRVIRPGAPSITTQNVGNRDAKCQTCDGDRYNKVETVMREGGRFVAALSTVDPASKSFSKSSDFIKQRLGEFMKPGLDHLSSVINREAVTLMTGASSPGTPVLFVGSLRSIRGTGTDATYVVEIGDFSIPVQHPIVAEALPDDRVMVGGLIMQGGHSPQLEKGFVVSPGSVEKYVNRAKK